ncbi:hypothetical protein J14TS2_28700 [Bacillus sp. J14TS2]|nr:hypothetical protein J14TS2_28700 [Bacillus sp. J14TS2]
MLLNQCLLAKKDIKTCHNSLVLVETIGFKSLEVILIFQSIKDSGSYMFYLFHRLRSSIHWSMFGNTRLVSSKHSLSLSILGVIDKIGNQWLIFRLSNTDIISAYQKFTIESFNKGYKKVRPNVCQEDSMNTMVKSS